MENQFSFTASQFIQLLFSESITEMQNVAKCIFCFYARLGGIKACADLRVIYWIKSLLQFTIAAKSSVTVFICAFTVGPGLMIKVLGK